MTAVLQVLERQLHDHRRHHAQHETGQKKMTAMEKTIRGRNERPNVTPSMACVSIRMLKHDTPPAMKIDASARREAKRSARRRR